MAHIYASLDAFKAYLTSGDYGSGSDASLVTLLESASAAVDSFCRRGAGFAADLADLVATTTVDGGVADDATTITLDDVSDLFVGQTVQIGEEELLITAIDEDAETIDVVRAQRGTEAAAILDQAPVYAFRYPSQVVDATIRVAQRRWKMRDAGLTGTFEAGPGLPATVNYDTEQSILRSTVGHLRLLVVA